MDLQNVQVNSRNVNVNIILSLKNVAFNKSFIIKHL